MVVTVARPEVETVPVMLLHAATNSAATNRQHVAATAWESQRNETAFRCFIVVFPPQSAPAAREGQGGVSFRSRERKGSNEAEYG